MAFPGDTFLLMARILTLTNWYPPHHFGGYEVLCQDVMTRLHGRGHEIEVICSDEVIPGVVAAPDAAFPVHRRLKMYWRDGAPWTPTVTEQLSIERDNQRELADLLERYKPDVVSIWHMGALSLNLLNVVSRLSVPMVFAICDDWLNYALALDPWARAWYRNPLRRAAGRLAGPMLGLSTVVDDLSGMGTFCFISRFTLEASLSASPWNYPSASIVYPGIDLARFPSRAPATTDDWKWRLLYMGRLDSRKGTETLLKAMAQLPPEATLSLFGRGEAAERARLMSVASEFGIADRVCFESIGTPQIGVAYRTHDCVIFPSEWSEPFGMVPLEAMASGTPVVATGVGGSAEYLVDRENCLLFAPGDPASLAEAVTRMSGNAGLRRALCAAGALTSVQFDVERTVDAFEDWHLAAASGGTVPAPWPAETLGAPACQVEVAPQALAALADVRGPRLVIGATVSDLRTSSAMVVLQERGRSARSGRTPLDGLGPHVVVADVMHLPFRSRAFAGVICQDALEQVEDVPGLVAELSRISERSGTVAFVNSNRRSVGYLKSQLGDWWRGRHRPPTSARVSTWSELEAQLAPEFFIEERVPIGWTRSPVRRAASHLLVGPLRSVSRSIMIAARPR